MPHHNHTHDTIGSKLAVTYEELCSKMQHIHFQSYFKINSFYCASHLVSVKTVFRCFEFGIGISDSINLVQFLWSQCYRKTWFTWKKTLYLNCLLLCLDKESYRHTSQSESRQLKKRKNTPTQYGTHTHAVHRMIKHQTLCVQTPFFSFKVFFARCHTLCWRGKHWFICQDGVPV